MTVEYSLVLPPFLCSPVAGSHLHRFLSAQRTHLRQLERRRQRSESRSCRCCLRRCQRRCLRSLLVFVVVFFIIGLKLICQLHDLTFNWLTPTTTRRWGSRHGAYDPFRFVSFRSVPSSAEARSLLPRSLADRWSLLPFFVCAIVAADCLCVFGLRFVGSEVPLGADHHQAEQQHRDDDRDRDRGVANIIISNEAAPKHCRFRFE